MSIDVVIIHPGEARTIYGGLADELTAIEPPIWCRIIAAFLRNKGHTVRIIDMEALGAPPHLLQKLILDKPKLAVLVASGHQPSASTQSMTGVAPLAIQLNTMNVPSIIVGGHASALPVRTLMEEPVTYICDGEGPLTIEDLLNGCDKSFIPGLVWRDGSGKSRHNPPGRLLYPETNEMEGDAWDLLELMKIYRAHPWQCLDDFSRRSPYASIYTSFGCPYKCLAGDTLINTIYGDIPIKELSETYADKGVPVYTYDPDTRSAFISDGVHIRKYGEQQQLVRVHFDDGTHIDCTPDHKFLQFSWKGKNVLTEFECEAQNLKEGTHVRALKFERHPSGYVFARWARKSTRQRYRMVMDYIIGKKLSKTEQVHHKDHNKSNDHPDNLEYCASSADHFKKHPEFRQRMMENNPAKKMTLEWRSNITAAVTGLRRTEESKERYRKAAIKREASRSPEERRSIALKREDKLRGWRWWTTPSGDTYRAVQARQPEDMSGRLGFDAHRGGMGNHRVTRVERLWEPGDVYCLTVPQTGWFYANNVLVKNCSFCMINAPFHSNKYRMRRPARVVAEIVELYHDYGVRTFKFADEMFVLNENHYGEICRRLIESGISHDINIWAYARVDTIKENKLSLLRKAGIKWLALGIESGSEHVREGSKKALKSDDIIGTVRAIQEDDINVIGNYIFGLEDDDEDSMEETLKLALECKTEFANFYSAMAYPGSKLYDEAEAKGRLLPERWSGYSQHSYDCLPLGNDRLSPQDVLQFRDAAFMRYFTDPLYLSHVGNKFGTDAVNYIMHMTEHTLRRKILENVNVGV